MLTCRFSVSSLCVAALFLVGAAAGQDPRGGAAAASPSAANARTPARGTTRGPLPDPVLLDGSTQQPEKKPEHGMLGEFEIPGDENGRGREVGGQPPPPQGGKEAPSSSVSIPGAAGIPSGGQSGGLPGLTPPAPMPSSGGVGGGAASLGEPTKGGAPGGPSGGPNDPNAKAEGIQVAELKTNDTAGPGGADAAVQKPSAITIGDPTMQIKPAPNAAGAVGAQTTAGATQQMEKATGGGSGKGSPGENANRGVEKGRAMPAGL